jgi:hypothetical protein
MDDMNPPPGAPEQPFSNIPWWAWLFAAACVAIPVAAMGGAIWGGLGFGAAGVCVTLARNTALPVRARVLRCSAVTLGAWVLFLLALLLAGRASSPPAVTYRTRDASGKVTVRQVRERPPTDLTDEAVRREIYAKGTRTRKTLKEVAADAPTDFNRKRLEGLEKIHATEIELTMKRYGLSRSQLDEVIQEGDKNGWPVSP